MDKRSLIAVVLSVLVLIVFQYFLFQRAPVTPPAPPEKAAPAPEKAAAEPDEEAPAPAPRPEVPAPEPGTLAEKVVRVETDLYTAELSSLGGTVKSWRLKTYKDDEGMGVSLLGEEPSAQRALAIGWDRDFALSNANFQVAGRDVKLEGEGRTATVSFSYSTDRYSVRRTYTFYSDSYNFDLVDEVEGLTEYFITLGADFGMFGEESRMSHLGPVLLQDMDREEIKPDKLNETRLFGGDIKWVALEDKYFCAAIVPRTDIEEAVAWKQKDAASIGVKAAPGVNKFMVYAGPKEHDRLKALGVGLEHIVDFGFFSVIARPIFWLLKQFDKLVGNYGWAIVLLTIVIRVPFIPIVHKGQKSMKRLQELQPRMQQIKEQFKKDPQQMQREMMGLYKKHKVNPMGGCLPMLLQIPVFFALYKVLLIAIELRGAPWILWIHDLSAKDPYYILPIVMGISMLIQQKMTPSAGDPRQQKMMMLMPIIFTFMFLNFASGLVLYWLVNNLLSIGQQIYINRQKA